MRKIVTFPARAAFKLAILAVVAVVGAVALGDHIQPVENAVASVLDWGGFDFDRAAYDPEVAVNPVRELELLDDLENEVEPAMLRVESRIRKNQAEIEYLAELQSFAETQLDQADVARLSAIVETPEAETVEDAIAKRWLCYESQIRSLTASRGRLVQMYERAQVLYDRMQDRRLFTVGLVPPDEDKEQVPANDMEEAELLLADVHEQLFKALYSIDPVLVSDTTSPAEDEIRATLRTASR